MESKSKKKRRWRARLNLTNQLFLQLKCIENALYSVNIFVLNLKKKNAKIHEKDGKTKLKKKSSK